MEKLTKFADRKLAVVGLIAGAILKIPSPDPATTIAKLVALGVLGGAYFIARGMEAKQ